MAYAKTHDEPNASKALDSALKLDPNLPEAGISARLVLGSLALSIPLIAVAGAQAGAFGVAMVCIAIVLVNLFVARR